MSGLVEWLSARLDEDEKAARAAQGPKSDPPWVAVGSLLLGKGTDGVHDEIAAVPNYVLDPVIEHAARWDPARVLAEVAAKRRILDEHPCGEPVDEPWCWSKVPWCERCSDADDGPTDYPCLTVRLLALPYAGRDGWREEWRPQ